MDETRRSERLAGWCLLVALVLAAAMIAVDVKYCPGGGCLASAGAHHAVGR